MRRHLFVTIVLAAGSAGAAPFPADSAYVPFHCGGQPMNDAFADDPAFLAERDLVGDTNAPTGLHAADAQYLYLQIRLDQDPAPGAAVRPSAWGMEFDLDGDRTTYEVLVTVDGIAGPAGTVSLFTNHTVTQPDDPSDPADTPAVKTYTFAAAARSIATSTTNGGNPDYFIDLALPWTDLAPLGLAPNSRTYVWAASSSAANALNGDFACNDGGAGPPTLDGAASDQTTPDPARDPGTGTGGKHLEGGGGCSAGTGAGWLGALAVAMLTAGRRRRCTAPAVASHRP
jgi:MYXO-CTERM domain-containing protein